MTCCYSSLLVFCFGFEYWPTYSTNFKWYANIFFLCPCPCPCPSPCPCPCSCPCPCQYLYPHPFHIYAKVRYVFIDLFLFCAFCRWNRRIRDIDTPSKGISSGCQIMQKSYLFYMIYRQTVLLGKWRLNQMLKTISAGYAEGNIYWMM